MLRHCPLLLLLFFLLFGCNEFRQAFRKTSPHEKYLASLRQAGLQQTALVQQWQQAATRALHDSLQIDLPYKEEGYFFADKAQAVGLTFSGKRGQKIILNLKTYPPAGFTIFMELYRLLPGEEPERVAFLKENQSTLEFEVEEDGSYLLRLQPELLKGGRYTLTVRLQPSLGFPLPRKDTRSIQSFWAAPRDGGSRKHEGVDIFAPRGTPVVAVSNGIVTRTGTNRLGGNVVWLRNRGKRASYYYAHLDSQLVSPGTIVRLGDTLGLVGNTGNARHTAPHLHFGIYVPGGAIDPLPFINNRLPEPKPVKADTAATGKLMRISSAQAHLRRSPGTQLPELESLNENTPFTVVAATGDWFRVQLPDERLAFLYSSLAGPAQQPYSSTHGKTDSIYDAPASTALLIKIAETGSMSIFGSYNGYALTKMENSEWGWVKRDKP